MNRVIFLSAFLIFMSSFCYGQDTAQLTRTPYKLTIAVTAHATYTADVKATPYVLPGNIVQLYPGEKVFVEVEQQDGIITGMKAVKENTNPAKTLVITFSQSVKNQAHEMMMLDIKNPFTQNLAYNAKLMYLKSTKWIDTDVLPVQAGLSGIETWPGIITAIALSGWELQAK